MRFEWRMAIDVMGIAAEAAPCHNDYCGVIAEQPRQHALVKQFVGNLGVQGLAGTFIQDRSSC